MKTVYSWTKKALSNTYDIYSGEKEVGYLTYKSLLQSATGKLQGRKFTFATKGFAQQNTIITDDETGRKIGEVRFNSWMTKADVVLMDNKFQYQADNIWNTQTSISDEQGIRVKLEGSSSRGTLKSTSVDKLLLLTALFITNHCWQMATSIFFAVFLPLIIVIIIL